MRKSGLPVPVAALLSGFVTAAAAQESARHSVFPPTQPASTTSLGREHLAGNPLWAIALSELQETRARPLFSPSRRPPSPPTVVAPAPVVKLASPPTPGPDHPQLTLLGTVVSQSSEIGVFTDEASHDVIRLKAGETHDGWTLRAVVDRAAFFEKEGYRAATLVLPAPHAEAAAATGGNARIRFAPPVINLTPVDTEGGSRRPPKEG
jgi:hypothetical protein